MLKSQIIPNWFHGKTMSGYNLEQKFVAEFQPKYQPFRFRPKLISTFSVIHYYLGFDWIFVTFYCVKNCIKGGKYKSFLAVFPISSLKLLVSSWRLDLPHYPSFVWGLLSDKSHPIPKSSTRLSKDLLKGILSLWVLFWDFFSRTLLWLFIVCL